jgi:L-lactate dehydrogenase complex protein LldE
VGGARSAARLAGRNEVVVPEPQDNAAEIATGPLVGLFVTCLVDLFRPSVGFAAIKLIEAAGCRVEVPAAQTCCGQPAYNSGDRKDTRAIARQVIAAFEPYDYVVAPSGSCAGMLKLHYAELFADEPEWSARAEAFSAKVHELIGFLVDIRGLGAVDAAFAGTITYHDSCSGLRELGIRDQPRRLLRSVDGLSVAELKDADVCCGFGGTFCVKYPDISNAIVEKKTASISASGADMLLAGDLGCLLNMAGKLKRQGSAIHSRHVAEVLAGMTDVPPIGEGH